jgi:tetratricopeptide (TPR) repeat protein
MDADDPPIYQHRKRWLVPLWVGACLAVWTPIAFAVYWSGATIQCLAQLSDTMLETCSAALDEPWSKGGLRNQIQKKRTEFATADFESAIALSAADDIIANGEADWTVHYSRGRALYYLDRTAEAAQALRKAYKLKPDGEYLFAWLIYVQIETKDYAAARRDAKIHTLNFPRLAEGYKQLGWIDYLDKKYDSAVYNLAVATSRDSTDAEAQNYYALALEKTGAIEPAIAAHTAAIKLNKTNQTYRNELAKLYASNGRSAEARQTYIESLRTQRSRDAIVGLAEIYVIDSNFDQAAPLINEAILLDNKDEWAHSLNMRWHYDQHNKARVRQAASALLAAVANSDYAIYWLARVDDDEGKDQLALESLLKLARVWPDDQGIRMRIGDVLMDLKRPQDAFIYIDEAIRLAPECSDCFAGRAHAHVESHNPLSAIADAQRAIELNSANGAAYAWRAKAYWALKNIGQARDDFMLAAIVSSELEWIREERASFLIETGDFDAAQADIEYLLEMSPEPKNALALQAELARALASSALTK